MMLNTLRGSCHFYLFPFRHGCIYMLDGSLFWPEYPATHARSSENVINIEHRIIDLRRYFKTVKVRQ